MLIKSKATRSLSSRIHEGKLYQAAAHGALAAAEFQRRGAGTGLHVCIRGTGQGLSFGGASHGVLERTPERRGRF